MPKKIDVIIALLVLITCGLSGCGQDFCSPVPPEALYMVVYSDVIQPDSGYFFVGESGEILGNTFSLKMQDLICFDVSESRIVVSGQRKNNTLIFDKSNSEFRDNFVFLNNSSFSGLTAVTSNDTSLLGIMNGNFSGDTYLNLLVLQTLEGKVIEQIPLEIFAHSVINIGDHAIVAGSHVSNKGGALSWCAEIIDCFLEDVEQYRYEHYNCFWDILEYDKSYICIAEDKSGDRDTLVMIDETSHFIEKEISVQDRLVSMFQYGNNVYAVGDFGIYEIDFNFGTATLCLEFAESLKSLYKDGSYTYYAYYLDGKVYVFLRYAQRMQVQGTYEYGNVIQVDLDSYDFTTTTISHPKRDGLNHVFVIPASFMKE